MAENTNPKDEKKIKFVIGTPLKTRRNTPIHKPGKRLMHGIALRFIQRRVAGGGHKAVGFDLNLTSMIDYLVITVVFLLSNFGTAQQMASHQALEIPTVPRGDPVKAGPILSISTGAVFLDAMLVAKPEEAINSNGRIDRLSQRLDEYKRNWPQLHPPTEKFEGDIIFQIDKSIPWKLVNAIARTCAASGFTNFHFAITKGGK